jgi:uncharacterized repeat protein (TIGR03833 family)
MPKKSSIIYEASPGYYFDTKEGKRVPKSKYLQANQKPVELKKGDKVQIIVKPYKKGKMVIGRIKRVLTKKKLHPRGRKVILENGVIGRLVKKF